jgi:transglutaminase-like putative cysteine protease
MFSVLFGSILLFALSLLKTEFTTIEKEWENGGKPRQDNERQNSLTRNDGMGTSTQKSMGLQGFNNRANKDSVMFVAKLDNFFPETEVPNPLYFVSDYYTRFDTISQSFETDSLRPYNDLFQPDLLSMPLYYTAEDTAVLAKSLGKNNRQVVTAEVYKTSLSPRHFTAPSTAFFVQPISVPNENKDIYRSAYRVKMMVSDLNSAYFVYNPNNDQGLIAFQEQRFAALRMVEGFREAPDDFLAYYTQMPKGSAYDSIRHLANQIVDTLPLAPIDKILAIRDYFVATDSSGNPTYRYSDNPGIPGIPGINRLCHFLFDSKKGYCAYYAGATLFLLRALGIPSRIATGFLTVDRSNKNPGWYWFYEDQAHAWVQVWFPGYGWLDFDTTVPSTETQEAPQPDQTPPLSSQTAWLVANGKVMSVDTANARVNMMVKDVLYYDFPFAPEQPKAFSLDVSIARILKDTGQVLLSTLQPGMDIVAVSFSEVFKAIKATKKDTWETVSEKWPAPLPIDEIKIIAPEPEANKETGAAEKLDIPY